MFEEFLTPIPIQNVIQADKPDKNKWEGHIVFNDERITAYGKARIAIIGVEEERGANENTGTAQAPDIIRRELYKLAVSNYDLHVIDMGNIVAGATQRDTYVALSKVVNDLLHNKIVPIIIGGSHDICFGQFGAYQELNELINVTMVDSCLDLESIDDEKIHNKNILNCILTFEPNYIFNLSIVGYQTHFTNPLATDTFEKLHFDIHRLGKVRGEVSEMEPVLRNSDMLCLDISAIRFADAPGCAYATPNGLNGEDACQLAYYAGLSEKISSFGLYEMNPHLDIRNQTAQLSAQIIWYFVDGFYRRKNDTPKEGDADFMKYIIHFKENGYEMVFWKSKRTDRWWLEVMPAATGKIKPKPVLIPCSYNDYLQATREELPERWMKAVGKLN